MQPWPRTYQEAVAWQEARRGEVRLEPLPRPPRLVGGADAAYDPRERRVFGAIAVYSYPELEPVEEQAAAGPCPFPYIPGLLGFREIPILAEIWGRLRHRPEVLLVDGQGVAHPRGFGIASQAGVLLEVATIGVAKSRLVGEGREPAPEAGAAEPLVYGDRVVGFILRTKTGVRPLFVSPGHKISLPEVCPLVLQCVKNCRLPEPLRRADALSRELRRLSRLGR